MTSPFHEGELKIQQLTRESDAAASNGKLISDRLPPGASSFILQQSYCVLGRMLPDQSIWTIFIEATKGFASADDEGKVLRFQIPNGMGSDTHLPPIHKFHEGDPLGTLFIELSTRRRLRVNGQITKSGEDYFYMNIEEAYPNCPKYIQRRELVNQPSATSPTSVKSGTVLDISLARWIQTTDTFFVASANPDGMLDVSHRGGKPGFIKIEDGKLNIPDYPGNSMFGTIGNFAICPKAGIVLVDFANNRQLQMTGNVSLDLHSNCNVEATAGTGRWWSLEPQKWIISPLKSVYRWSDAEFSPFNP